MYKLKGRNFTAEVKADKYVERDGFIHFYQARMLVLSVPIGTMIEEDKPILNYSFFQFIIKKNGQEIAKLDKPIKCDGMQATGLQTTFAEKYPMKLVTCEAKLLDFTQDFYDLDNYSNAKFVDLR
jgi:hypothetical protein